MEALKEVSRKVDFEDRYAVSQRSTIWAGRAGSATAEDDRRRQATVATTGDDDNARGSERNSLCQNIQMWS